ncbi:MAG: ribosomal protein large subunit ribosomal protein [Candidatus Parcubacteria bacterium]|jgi:large subunit ribosomal protein L16
MLFPKKVKHRKWQVTRRNPSVLKKRVESRGTTLANGSFGMLSTTQARITSNQIESARKVIARSVGKTGRIWVRIFPDRPFTRKAAEVPMGSGKGEPAGFCFETYAGRMLFEVDGVDETIAKEAFRKASSKLPVKTKMVSR